MVKRRPYQQAGGPDRGRRRDARSRSFVARAVVLASVIVVAGALLLAPRADAPTLGADGPAVLQPPVTAALTRPQTGAATLSVVDAPIPDVPDSPVRGTPYPGSITVASPWPAGSLVLGASPRPTARGAAPPTSAEPEDLRGYSWPLYRGRMMMFFGPEYNGFLVVGGQRVHPGLDTTTFCGDQVRAAHRGVVVAVGRRFASQVGFSGPLDKFYGKIARRHTMGLQPIVVVVDDGNGYRSVYVHLEKVLVKVGDRVKHSTVVGLEGATGHAAGCHVHYELVRMDGPWMRVAGQLVKEYGYPAWERERVDPLRVLNFKGMRAGRFVPGLRPPKLPASLRPPG